MNKALFLDRDGVINVDYGYVHKKEDFVFIDGIFDFVKKYYQDSFLPIIVTNQSGIARGYYTVDDFINLMEWVKEEFKKRGIEIFAYYFCSQLDDSAWCRKPNPGMIFEAKKDWNLALESSILVGDSIRDIVAGLRAGVGLNFLYDPNNKFENVYAVVRELTNGRHLNAGELLNVSKKLSIIRSFV